MMRGIYCTVEGRGGHEDVIKGSEPRVILKG